MPPDEEELPLLDQVGRAIGRVQAEEPGEEEPDEEEQGE